MVAIGDTPPSSACDVLVEHAKPAEKYRRQTSTNIQTAQQFRLVVAETVNADVCNSDAQACPCSSRT
jgi:hypothetical protein